MGLVVSRIVSISISWLHVRYLPLTSMYLIQLEVIKHLVRAVFFICRKLYFYNDVIIRRNACSTTTLILEKFRVV